MPSKTIVTPIMFSLLQPSLLELSLKEVPTGCLSMSFQPIKASHFQTAICNVLNVKANAILGLCSSAIALSIYVCGLGSSKFPSWMCWLNQLY